MTIRAARRPTRPPALRGLALATCLALVALVAITAMTGCSILEPRADPTRFFVLAPVAGGEAAPAAAGNAPGPALVIVLGPVVLPDYLLRPEIVRRTGPNQLEPSRVDRWGEPLDRAILRVLCLDLASSLPGSSVVPFPAAPGARPDAAIEIEIVGFEADSAGVVRLQGRWRFRAPHEAAEGFREIGLERSVGSPETPDVVAGMSALLAELARGLAVELETGARR